MKTHLQLSLALLFAASFAYAASVFAEGDALEQASWSVPQVAEVKQQLETWLTERKVAADLRTSVLKQWNESAQGEELLRSVANSIAQVDADAKTLVSLCEQPPAANLPATFKILTAENTPAWVRANLRLLCGVWLARHDRYDEAAEHLAGLQPEEVVDPAGLLFYQAVTAHRLLKKDECLPLIKRLLENKNALPQRFVTVAKLMQQDIAPLEPDSLDEISRLMDDVRRRLDLGRAGKKVRDEEQAIIAKLEKKIKELEQQRKKQQQQQQAGNQPKNQTPATPAEQSQVPRDIHATDETDPKSFSKKENWGNLPPKQRQQALQQIGRDLPSHFRDTIEEYFKRLAQDGNE